MKLYSSIARFFATGFYIGYFPVGPGTMASFVFALCYYFLPELSFISSCGLAAGLLMLGVWATGIVERHDNVTDGSYMVIDEFLGMQLALIAVPKTIWMYALVFILFRFFDIAKIYPISWCESYFKGGFGVMIDDVVAAAMTQVVFIFIFKILTIFQLI